MKNKRTSIEQVTVQVGTKSGPSQDQVRTKSGPSQDQVKSRFKSFVGLKSATPKLHRWLTDFNFIDIATVEGMVDWEESSIKFANATSPALRP